MTRTIESLDALRDRIVTEDARKHDVIADTRRMSVIAPQADSEVTRLSSSSARTGWSPRRR